jgi:hypothetical protein
MQPLEPPVAVDPPALVDPPEFVDPPVLVDPPVEAMLPPLPAAPPSARDDEHATRRGQAAEKSTTRRNGISPVQGLPARVTCHNPHF